MPVLPGPVEPRRVLTDTAGRFSFRVNGSARARLEVSRQGYRSETSGDTATVYVNAGDRNVTIKLVPLSAIEGRVLNQDGEPLPGLTVEATRIEIRRGVRELSPSASKVTDDLGAYRLWHMSPGSYYVKVLGRRGTVNAYGGMPQPGQSDEAYGPWYYPGVPNREAAQVLRLGPGENLRLDFSVEGRKALRVAGMLTGVPRGRRFAVRLLRDGDVMGSRATVDVSSGRFQVHDVNPGSYTLQAYTDDAAGLLFGEASVTVENADAGGIEITLRPGLEAAGVVESGVDSRYLHVIARHTAGGSLPPDADEEVGAEVEEGGRFVLKPLWPGTYEISVFGAGDFYLASAMSGSIDVLRDGLTVGTASPPELKLVFAQGLGTIRAKVDGLRPGETATVWAVRKNGGIGEPAQFSPEAEGNFAARGLAPGEYTVYAWRSTQQLEYRNPAVLESLSAFGRPVSLAAGAAADVVVPVIPKDSN